MPDGLPKAPADYLAVLAGILLTAKSKLPHEQYLSLVDGFCYLAENSLAPPEETN